MADNYIVLKEILDTMKEDMKKLEVKMLENHHAVLEKLKKVEETMQLLEIQEKATKVKKEEELADDIVSESLKNLEMKVTNLEVSIQKVVESQFTKVAALVAQLEVLHILAIAFASQPLASTTSSNVTAVASSNISVPSALANTQSTPPTTNATADTPALRAQRYILSRSLWCDAEDGVMDDIQKKLDNGADVNFPDVYGTTPLMWASQNGHEDIVSLLLERGANVHVKNKAGITALHYAARSGHEHIMSLLLQKGANIHAKCAYGSTALHLAALNNREMCMYKLICAGADVDSISNEGMTPLHNAAKWDQVAAVRMLVEVGASKTIKDNSGNMPLAYSTKDSVRMLLGN